MVDTTGSHTSWELGNGKGGNLDDMTADALGETTDNLLEPASDIAPPDETPEVEKGVLGTLMGK